MINFVLESGLPLVYWFLISACHYLAKSFTISKLEHDKCMRGIDAAIWYVSCIVGVCVLSYFIFATLNPQYDENEEPMKENVKWIQIFVPMLIPWLVGIYSTIKKHNDKILNKNKPNYKGTHEEFMKSINLNK